MRGKGGRLLSAFRALLPQRPRPSAAVMLLDKGASRGFGSRRAPPFAPVRRRFRWLRYCRKRHCPAMVESVLQMIGDISGRVGAAPEIDAPFAAEAGN